MFKSLAPLLLLLSFPLVTAAQEPPGRADDSPLEVLDADVAAYAIRPDAAPFERLPEPPPVPQGRGEIPGQKDIQRRSDKTSIASRTADLHDVETRAKSTKGAGGKASGYEYEYRVRVRNVSSKKVKSMLWEYRLLDSPVTAASRRLFQCAGGVKPGETRRLSAWTLSAPVSVVSADGAAGMKPKAEVFVNRVEYADGSVWQRAGWEPVEAKGGSQQGADRKLRRGDCSAL